MIDGLCAFHAAALESRNRTNDDPLRLLYFGTFQNQPLTHPRLSAETLRLRRWWYEACVAGQSAEIDQPVGVVEAMMEWCLVIAAQLCHLEDRHRHGLTDDPAETIKTKMFWQRLEMVGTELRGPGPGSSIH